MKYIFEKLKLGTFSTNCYIFGDAKTREVVIIDPGYEGNEIHDLINLNKYKVKYILLTHGHHDHIGGVGQLKEITGAQILIHKLDAQMLIDPHENLSLYIGRTNSVVQPKADKLLNDEDILNIGSLEFKIIHTPGHTRGGICILFEDILFSGDTLFKETIGRTDLPNSDYSDIIDSVEKLMVLNDDIKVYPGHGNSSTIGYERKNNPFIK